LSNYVNYTVWQNREDGDPKRRWCVSTHGSGYIGPPISYGQGRGIEAALLEAIGSADNATYGEFKGVVANASGDTLYEGVNRR
jgi:hypothetical protein